jgi:predicted nucleotidyltransferase component of viral defense system
MHEAIKTMLAKYTCHSEREYTNALKEIFQEIALLGLWRSKFYEKAAFYGGTALRIMYGLDRFSEDLDFSLLQPNADFDLAQFNQAIKDELGSFGFDVEIEKKHKHIDSNIDSAFIKAETKKQLILINAPAKLVNRIHHMRNMKIKMEVDINPPGNFNTESKTLLNPIPFSVKTYQLPDLFAGKLHALLCRPWQQRVKGRDWYDLVWYIARQTPVNLTHLEARLRQSGAWNDTQTLSIKHVHEMLHKKINETDFDNAKNDILPFINDKQAIDLWSTPFFLGLVERLTAAS